ncbi:MAG: hypothetical protein K6G03_10145 [Lachnospiraceae bacterium]|nr:hypothetical protein [Lachnospiraceae bacterium]
MQEDFHYYGTYCAAYLAGYTHEESLDICYSAQLVDLCSRTFLNKIRGPESAATTQLQLELMDTKTNILNLQDITRIWASFHFLPYDLYAKKKWCFKRYLNKYRLICDTNSDLLRKTVILAKDKSLQAVGLAMHVLADTWAHRYFAGTPSLVINNTDSYFYEILPGEDYKKGKKVIFRHSPSKPDDLKEGVYSNSVAQGNEHSIMNLGHGRAGHLPDYSFIRYKYMPAWGDYREIIKDNPSDYMHAFCQMIYALKYFNGTNPEFEVNHYDIVSVEPWKDEIEEILTKRQLDASEDWKALGEKLSGNEIPAFDINKYQSEYIIASMKDKKDTFLGKFINAAMIQKSMVTHEIFISGNLLAGISVDVRNKGIKGIKGIKDYLILLEEMKETLNNGKDRTDW